MQILLQLGANNTAFIQFVLFVLSISILTIFVYGPFFKAYDKRAAMTKGADQVATETQDQAKKIEAIYASKAKEINEKVSKIYDEARKIAAGSAETVLTQAKKESTQKTEKARKEIETQKAGAAKDIESISKEIANEITKKLSGTIS